MKNPSVDILFISYNRPEYTAKSLKQLLSTCNENSRVWVWHNGTHEETLEIVKYYLSHPRLFKFHHSKENLKLIKPTNWLWENANGDFLGKVDDDGLVSDGWIEKICYAHNLEKKLGIIGSWYFHRNDFILEVAQNKMLSLNKEIKLIQNCWVSGNGYIMKKECLKTTGLLKKNSNFTDFCIKAAQKGWLNGWIFPLIYLESMDDPRSPHTILKNDSDLRTHLPLSAILNGVDTIQKWQNQLIRSALLVQKASPNPKYYVGWRRTLKTLIMRIKRILGIYKQW